MWTYLSSSFHAWLPSNLTLNEKNYLMDIPSFIFQNDSSYPHVPREAEVKEEGSKDEEGEGEGKE